MEIVPENSCLEGDSNAIILPARKNNKRKSSNQEKGAVKNNKQPKLSNSQKRKLKKLEEEKDRALLLSKSIETLEKYKLPEDAFSLMQSSRNISRAGTVKEKRRMAVQFCKAGLRVPESEQPFMSRDKNDISDTECEPKEILSRQDRIIGKEVRGVVEIKVAKDSSASVTSYHEPAKEVADKNDFTSVRDDTVNSSPVLSNADMGNNSTSTGKLKENSTTDTGKAGNLKAGPSQRPLTTPTVVHVSRPDEVEEKRKDLPIVMMEQEIMEAINENPVVIICGETGCGKTTQVPQFLYEAGFGSNLSTDRSGIIGVTQPRRVAVLATAKRVAFELGVGLGKGVGFQVRHDKKLGDSCSIKFMTDGILLREVQSDFLLKRYSVIVLDEAHERSVNTDILIGMLSRVVPLRQKIYEAQQNSLLSGEIISPEDLIFPLKLVLMSATLRVEDFVSGGRLFHDSPPVIEVPTRQFPVTVHFSKRTEVVDYIGQAFKKILSIHKRLPPGGILVFVTGQREVEYLCQRLRKASKELINRTAGIRTEVIEMSGMNSVDGVNMEDLNEAFGVEGNLSEQQTDSLSSYDEDIIDFDEDKSDVSYNSETESDLEFDDDDAGSRDQKTTEIGATPANVLEEEVNLASLKAAFEALAGKTALDSTSEGKEIPVAPESCSEQSKNGVMTEDRGDKSRSPGALQVLPLYAMLPPAAQLRVFDDIKEGERLVIVATNVAETSLTIPGIKYVVDTGREKVKNYNPSNGIEEYQVQWISKASAAQRAGRAGRTGPGHCYRLYSSAAFSNVLPDFSCAEISKVPVESIVLILKSMSIEKVANFPFPTPPEATALVEAERCLKTLEALGEKGLTPLGKAMACYPMSPRHSRMLLTVIQIMSEVKNLVRTSLVLGYAVAVAAALSLSNPFLMQIEGNSSGSGLDQDQDDRFGSVGDDTILDKKEKSLKAQARISQSKFSNPSSDALTVAFALQCFECSKTPKEFCHENALHLKTMEEMSKLRKQLLHIVCNQNVTQGIGKEFSWTYGSMKDVEEAWRDSSSKSSLSPLEEQLLGQAICAGWADRVAKRMRATSGREDQKASTVRYQACMVKENVFLHRQSSLSKSAPEFLVYSELLYTKRPYMHGATRVEPKWLVNYAKSLCSFSIVEDPKPSYEHLTDQVFCWAIPSFGPHLWQLPLHKQPIKSIKDRVKVFAYALLEGNVLPCLIAFRNSMAARPSIILEREVAHERRVGNLVFKLEKLKIDSCAKLKEIWKDNPMELHSEILDWFKNKKSFQEQFEVLWSQMHVEVQLGPEERFSKNRKKNKRKKQLGL
ncbi:hypothetical protein Tsubulata_027768 [Turnera subulata]|uniref:RNA helicase n=1 Tax=Turnera subulata TaxID=218843 RepID=A0A9Q0GHE1_9ROSI|nr:hypothetical protein Tsubulata_027768 [Turnera subulata]